LSFHVAGSAQVEVSSSKNGGCHVNKEKVRSTSLARKDDSNATVFVRWFRGDGTAENSHAPHVNSSVVYSSLFDQNSFTSVFMQKIEEKPAFERKSNPRNFSLSSRLFIKISLTVNDARRPVIIGDNIIHYFWNVSSLPKIDNFAECFHYTTMNDAKSVSFCNITKMDRCAANISDFSHLAPFSFHNKNGQRLTQFSWLCREGQSCCAYECCDLVDMFV
ncbi:hypothetical protein PMAYCL1PPCAC_07885, partial [Pristionchus mayeri]